MGRFDSILDKVKKSASERDAGVAKQKCPLKKKPALYIVAVRGDTGKPVSGIEVDISKPSKKSMSTNGDGEIKLDPAKKGSHGLKVILSKDQAKEFATPNVQRVTTSTGKTSIAIFVLEPLPKLLVTAKDMKDGKPLDGVRVTAGRQPMLNTASGKADFGGIPAGKYRVTVDVPKPLESIIEVFFNGVLLKKFDPGHVSSWEVPLRPGETRSYEVRVAQIRWVEFILAEEGTDKPIAGAKIFAKVPGGGQVQVETNQTGNARVTYSQDGKVEIEKIEMREPGKVMKVETR